MFANFFKVVHLFHQILLNFPDGILQYIGRGHKHIGRINGQLVKFLNNRGCFYVKTFNFFNFIAKKMNPKRIIGITGIDFYGVAFDAETARIKFGFGARIQTLHQLFQQFRAGNYLISCNSNHIFLKFDWVSNPVQTGNRSHHQYISTARKEGSSCAQAHFF